MEQPSLPTTTSADKSASLPPGPPIRLLCVGAHRSNALLLHERLKPHYTYCAILNTIAPNQTYSLENLDLVLDALHPTPAGVIVGGAFSDEEGKEMARVVAMKETESGVPIKLVKVPTGIFEREGFEGLLRKIRELLFEEFAV